MKHKLLSLLIPIVSVSLSSCAPIIDYKEHLDDYVYVMKYHDNFNILQLTDIHWNIATSTTASEIYMNKLFAEVNRKIKAEQGANAKIDLVELTGDQFMLSNTYHVRSFVKYFEAKAEEYGFKYAVIWGNHDRHGLYNPNWLSDQFLMASHCIYKEPNDNLYGRSNFVINLTTDGLTFENNTVWQIANLDSGASFSDTALDIKRTYDYIRKDQTDWWIKEHNKAGGSASKVPTIAYYHIPTQDFEVAYSEVMEDRKLPTPTIKSKFFKLEGIADNGKEEYASDFVTKGSQNNLKAVFIGHDHNNDWTVEYKGVVIGYGVKTGTELYFAHVKLNSDKEEAKRGYDSLNPEDKINEDFDLIGASLVTIKDSENYTLEHLYYNERATGDFARWVKW